MAGGLRYAAGREMPPGMQEIYARKLVAQQQQSLRRNEETAGPCDTCCRWSECNGADKENCPLWGNNKVKER